MKAAWSAVLALAVGIVVGCGAGVVEADGAEASLTTSEAALAVCGDGVCELGERRTCPADCPQGEFCGNGQCCPGETMRSCPQDCSQGDPGQFCYRSH